MQVCCTLCWTTQYLEISNKHRTFSKSVWTTFLSTRETRTGVGKSRHVVVYSQRPRKPKLPFMRIFFKKLVKMRVKVSDFFMQHSQVQEEQVTYITQQLNSMRKTCLSGGHSKTLNTDLWSQPPSISFAGTSTWTKKELEGRRRMGRARRDKHAQACSVCQELLVHLRWVYTSASSC